MNSIKVLMVGSETKIRGGMTTVVEAYLNNEFKHTSITYIPTHYSGNKLVSIGKFALKLHRLASKIKESDIIHMHMSERGSCIRKYLIYKIAKKNNKKVITHMHGAEFKEYYDAASDSIKNKILELLKNSDYVLTLGKNWNEYVKSIDKDINAIILKNSVDIPNLKSALDNKIFNILFLAVIEKRKGIYELIEASKVLVEKYKGNKEIKFIIAGSGREEENIKKLVKEYNMEEYFEFKGWINGETKKELLAKSHLFVLPSYNEGLPLSILEAISYGIPIVSTNVGSIDEAVINKENGFLVKVGDVEELEEKIEEILKDENKWEKMSQKSKKICEKNFDIEKYFENIEKIYTKCLK